jgi:IMP dehydrogenase
MATYFQEPSRTFSEYLLIPNLTRKECIPEIIDLSVPLVKYYNDEPEILLNIPITSAIMQAVSDHNLAIALAKCGGLSFIFCSQPIDQQAAMIKIVKKFKAGFVISDSNLRPSDTLKDVLNLIKYTGHSTIAITEDGTNCSKLLGMLTSRDYRLGESNLGAKINELMTPFSNLIHAKEGISLKMANDIIWEHKLNCLPIIDENQCLLYLVFRKDYESHQDNPDELLDNKKRLFVGAGINTKDYHERVPVLVDEGVDILCVDSSDGFTEWQKDTIEFVKNKYEGQIKIGGGNVVDREGFIYLAEAGADFVKVGIGGGSICITREQKGIGRGQATAVIEVASSRDEYFKRNGIYIPICSDGGIVHDNHIILALAMGADFVMMGKYFAGFDESPTRKIKFGDNYVKEYWAEGSNRAMNWQRYDLGSGPTLEFEEGVDSYVPYAGKLNDNINITINKIKSTMCNCGAKNNKELRQNARITLVSSTSIIEGGVHDVIKKDKNTRDE